MGCHFLLQGIFLSQGWNMGLLHCRQILYHLSHQGSPYVYYTPIKKKNSLKFEYLVISHYDILDLVSNFSAFRKNNIFWLLCACNFKLKRILNVFIEDLPSVDTKQSDVQITKKIVMRQNYWQKKNQLWSIDGKLIKILRTSVWWI